METLWDYSKLATQSGAYQKTKCRPECELLLDHSSYGDQVYTVPSLDDLDPRVKEEIVAHLVPGEALCQILVCPTSGLIGRWREPGRESKQQPIQKWDYDWVLVLAQDHILLIDAVHTAFNPKIAKAPIQCLLSIEWGRVLLHSWIAWSWLEDTHIEHARVEFDAMGEKPIEEMMGYLHGSRNSPQANADRPSIGLEERLRRLPSKFVERIPLLVAPQEAVVAVAYSPFQPAAWTSWHGLFRKLERKAIPALALIVTERQAIIVREAEHESDLSLGTIVQTIRLKEIKNILRDGPSSGVQLILEVGRNDAVERIVVNASEACVQEMFEMFRSYLASR